MKKPTKAEQNLIEYLARTKAISETQPVQVGSDVWHAMETIGGAVLIVDIADEDAPIATLHGPDALRNALIVMRALAGHEPTVVYETWQIEEAKRRIRFPLRDA